MQIRYFENKHLDSRALFISQLLVSYYSITMDVVVILGYR